MPAFRDLTKEPPFGRLTVIERGPNRGKQPHWHCICTCGTRRLVSAGSLTSGRTQSCGCFNVDYHTTHGGTGTAEHKIWFGMKQRCLNSNHIYYARYGGRGIRICERWLNSFENFLADVGPRPSGQHTLDRYPDKNGNYEPGNVRWATQSEQSRNRRNNKIITIDGHTDCLKAWLYRMNMPYGTYRKRIKRGLTDEQALKTPVKIQYRHKHDRKS